MIFFVLDNFKLRSPFQNIYYFQPTICPKIDGKKHEKIVKGILLIPANSAMSEKSEGFVHNFTVVGPVRCQTNSWFALPSPKFLNSDGNIVLVERKKDLLRTSNDMRRFLNSYLEALNGTDSARRHFG